MRWKWSCKQIRPRWRPGVYCPGRAGRDLASPAGRKSAGLSFTAAGFDEHRRGHDSKRGRHLIRCRAHVRQLVINRHLRIEESPTRHE